MSSRTVVFSFTVANHTASTLYTIDFGDGSLIGVPESMNNPNQTVQYTYSTSGIYNVVLTVFNSVLTSTQNLTVRLNEIKIEFVFIILILFLKLKN